jgi:Flp pilus assembly protein TadD
MRLSKGEVLPMLRALRATPPSVSQTTIESLYAAGYWLFMQRRAAHAQSVFRAMIHLSPGDERGWLALGACYEGLGQPDLAFQVYGTGTRAAATAPRCFLARARILRAEGRPSEAQRALVDASRAMRRSRDADLRELIAAEWERVVFEPQIQRAGEADRSAAVSDEGASRTRVR